jgi:predicted HTH domain antitoxin
LVKLAFELDVPDGAIDRTVQGEFVRSVKELAVLKLYAGDLITTGEAAKMLGITRIQFLDLLNRSGVGFHVELDDEDFRTFRRWREDSLFKGGP